VDNQKYKKKGKTHTRRVKANLQKLGEICPTIRTWPGKREHSRERVGKRKREYGQPLPRQNRRNEFSKIHKMKEGKSQPW